MSAGGSGSRGGWLLAGVLVVMLLTAASLALGSHPLALSEVLDALTGRAGPSTDAAIIVNTIRLPRTLASLLAGAALGAGGLVMQTVFRNALAGPGILGVNAGAGLGVACVLLAAETIGLGALRAGGAGTTLAALVGAGAAMAVVLTLSRWVGSLTLLVVGILLSQFAAALTSVLIHLSSAVEVQRYASWTLGSFQVFGADRIGLLAGLTALGVGLTFTGLPALNAWALGDDGARSLGIHVGRQRLLLVGAASLLAGAVTAYCGPIAFLGVAVPHLARGALRTADHRWLLPGSILAGAATALIADILTRLSDGSLPVNSVLALVGAPVVALVVLRARRRWEGAAL